MLALSAGRSGRFFSLFRFQNCSRTFLEHQSNITRHFSCAQPSQAKLKIGDRVLLRAKPGKDIKRKLTKPLREDGEQLFDGFTIKHQDLIGKESGVRLLNVSKDGINKLKVHACHPTIDEFTSLSPRRVAPIYATYASTIVSLLDINVEPCSAENDPAGNEPSFQILEAGTGQGSLTLQLSRAIALANPPFTEDVLPTPSTNVIYKAGEEVDGGETDHKSTATESWKQQRRAVLHTVDIDPGNRDHADKLIRSYRHAVYWPHIDFYAGDVKQWVVDRRKQSLDRPFLDIVILDMPGVEEYIASVVDSIKDEGCLLAFVPQITQIATCVQEIVTKDLGIKLERVVELGDGISTGRDWDVRMATLKNAKLSKFTKSTAKTRNAQAKEDITEPKVENSFQEPTVGTIPPMVCRPLVGEMTRGGGFIGLWKKVAKDAQGV